MTRKTGLLLMPLCIIALFLTIFDFAPRASMKGRRQGEAVKPQPPLEIGYRSPTARHKVQVSDASLAGRIGARGGRLVGNYETYQIYEVDTATIDSLASEPSIAVRDEDNLVMLNAGAIDTTGAEIQSARRPLGAFEGKRMHLVQFAAPVKPEWYRALADTGAQIITYIPNNAYLVYGHAKSLQAVQRLAANVGQWDTPYTSRQRLDASLAHPQSARGSKTRMDGEPKHAVNLSVAGHELYAVQLVADEAENQKTLALIDEVKLEPVLKRERFLNYVNIVAALAPEVVAEIAERADVVSIQRWVMPKKMDERQNMIIAGNLTGNAPAPGDYLAYLAGRGFSFGAATFGVNVSDSGIDNATTTPNHFALYTTGDATTAASSRVVYNRLEGRPNSGSTLQGCDGHGNINAHIIGGFVPTGSVNGVNFAAAPHADAQGFRYGLGVAPFVKLGSSVIFDPNNFTNPNYFNLEARAYNDGMRISSNSWGADSSAYSIDSQQYDALVRDAQPSNSVFPTPGNQEQVIVFAAGNAGGAAGSIGFPASAKNVISVGAAENVHPFSGVDGCGVSDAGADNINDIVGFSSRGPTSDGRRKPDIMAPGTHVTGGVAQAATANPVGSGSGSKNACFNGGGVCGGVSSFFFPANQQYYTASSGTSHSTPAIAGAAALLRQHFLNRGQAAPSPALTKALMMNSARYMTGAGANDTLPSNNQGMGELSLNNYFDIFDAGHILRDQTAIDTFNASGQERTFTGNIADNNKPFRVTLAWTDAPGPTAGNAFVNNLDLEVTIGGQVYRGNVFSGAHATTGGTADTRNNVESVFLPAGAAAGNFVVRVRGTNIAGNGVPGVGGALDQDFALVVSNAVALPAAVINAGAASLTSESVTPANNTPDPGETVTANFPLNNVGTSDTANLVATLQSSGGITPVGNSSRTYGVLAASGAPVSQPFTFTAAGACGSEVTATLALSDGANNLGTVTYTFHLGTQSSATILSQNFDTTNLPALPGGWTSAHMGGTADWITSNTRPDSAPHAAFAPNNPTVSSLELMTPSIAISSSTARLTFRHAYNLEADSTSTVVGYDGMVLEIQIGAGSYTDIVAAGGNFLAGGYTRSIDTNYANPISGRQAWSGLSAGTIDAPGYITSIVNLPRSAAGQNIRLRWRVATDSDSVAVGAAEVRIDSIAITDFISTCNTQACSITCPANIFVAAEPGQNGAIVNYPNPAVTGSCQNVSGSPATGAFFPSGTTTVNVSTGAGAACSFTVTVSQPLASSTLAISEFRLRGAQGALDEYIEIVNLTDRPFTVASGDNSGGWSIAALDATGTQANIIAVIPNDTVIPARGHYLIANNTPATGYSLGNYGGTGNAIPNATYTADIPDNTGIGLFNTSDAGQVNFGRRIDAVGFAGQSGALASLFSEGDKLPDIGSSDGEYAFVRKQTTGIARDTGDNARDFDFVSPDAGVFGAVQSLPGAPGPENLSSPTQRNAGLKASLVDPACNAFGAADSACARHRDGTPDAANRSTLGTLSLRRKFTNKTGEPVTRLRFRIVDLTAGAAASSGTADLRARTSLDFVATCADICLDTGSSATDINGVTLETTAGANTGGINSTLAQGKITLDSKLAPGASTNVHFLLGVERNGSFRFLVNVEAVTSSISPLKGERKSGEQGGRRKAVR